MHHFFKFAIDGVTGDNPKQLLNDSAGSITRDPFGFLLKEIHRESESPEGLLRSASRIAVWPGRGRRKFVAFRF